MATEQEIYNYIQRYRFTIIYLLQYQFQMLKEELDPILDKFENEGEIDKNGEYVHYTGDSL